MLSQNQNEFAKANILNWHKAGYTGKGVKIAIMDDGQKPFRHSMPYIHLPYDNHYRGEHAAYVIEVIRQIIPDAAITKLNYFDDPDQSLKYIEEHKDEIDIINCSWGRKRLNGKDVFEHWYNGIKDLGIPIVVATGNDGDNEVSTPAFYDWTIAVGAMNESTDKVASYSNYGKEVDCVGYSGIYIQTDSNIQKFSGTSCASPFVTSLLGLYIQKCKEIRYKPNLAKIREFIYENSKDYGDVGKDEHYGNGLFILPDIKEVILLKDIEGHWAVEEIKKVARQGIMNGYPDKSFRPDQPVSRAELAKVICRLQKVE